MKFIIDRIEDDKLVLEDAEKRMIDFTITDMKVVEEFKEGDVIDISIDGTITLLKEEILKRKRQIEGKTKDLWK